MERKYLILSLLTVFAIFTASCSREKTPAYQDGQGGVEFSLSSQLTDTKADARDANINIDDFKVELINSSGVIFKRWRKYSDYKSQEDKTVLLNAGSRYTLRATYGDSTAVGFDAFFFMGDTTFVVPPQSTVTMDVVCKQSNVEVAVVYGNTLKTEYTNYHATVKHKRTKDSLEFIGTTSESGYIRPGELNLYLYITDEDGAAHRFGTKAPYLAAAGDSITFIVDSKPTPTYELAFNITINSSTVDTTINIPIDSYMLSADAPKIVPDGFDINSGRLACLEGVKPSAAGININAQSGIKSCVMTVNSAYLKSIGWPSSIDFFNIPADVKNILNRDGLLWTSDMTGLPLANIDFKNVAKIIKYTDAASADNTFGFTIVDNSEYAKTISASYIISITPATIEAPTLNNVDIWAKKATAVVSTNGDASILVPQVKIGDGAWTVPAYTSSVSGTSATFAISGLTPGTDYSVRGVYNNGTGSSAAFTTETAAQVGNAGFEDWTSGTRFDQPIYYPWTSDKWWDTNSNGTMPKSYTTYPNFKCFPTVWYTTESHSGSKAAQIRSISINGANSEIMGIGNTQGRLYIGTADGSGNASPSGHAFPSRPASLEFYYKYAPQGTDEFSATIEIRNGSTVIGTGEFKLSTGSAVNSYTKAAAAINYSRTDLKADGIYIIFLQSTNSSPSTSKQTISIPAGSYKVYTGSCLTIDDITLTY